MSGFILTLELIGTAAFAVSGAVMSIKKRFDIFGVLFCAVATALGGGVLRDIMLSNLPPVMFREEVYFLVAVITAVGVFLVARQKKEHFAETAKKGVNFINLFDALGLGIFTVVGINTAVTNGFGDNAFFCVFLGMTTGCGGGILRDVVAREVPVVFSKQVYAVASIAGGIVYYSMAVPLGLGEPISVFVGVAVIFTLRVLAATYRWDLPRAY